MKVRQHKTLLQKEVKLVHMVLKMLTTGPEPSSAALLLGVDVLLGLHLLLVLPLAA